MLSVEQLREKAKSIRSMGAATIEAYDLEDIADELERLQNDEAGCGWIEGPDVPVALEGHQAWKWVEGKGAQSGASVDVIPRGFSRDPKHCGGVWFMPIIKPVSIASSRSSLSRRPVVSPAVSRSRRAVAYSRM